MNDGSSPVSGPDEPRNAACEAARAALAARLYGECDGPAEAALERHLAGCAACRDAEEELRAARAELDRWRLPEGDVPTAELVFAVRSAASPAPLRRPRPRRRTLVLAALAGAVAMFLLGLFEARLAWSSQAVELGARLPWATVPAEAPAVPDPLDELRRELAASAERAEALAVAYAEAAAERDALLLATLHDGRVRDRELLLTLIDSLSRASAREDLRNREAMVELASYVMASPTDNPISGDGR